MAEQKESSVLFSLKELMGLEEQRIREEEADRDRRAREEMERKATAERAARDAEERRLREEEAARRQAERLADPLHQRFARGEHVLEGEGPHLGAQGALGGFRDVPLDGLEHGQVGRTELGRVEDLSERPPDLVADVTHAKIRGSQYYPLTTTFLWKTIVRDYHLVATVNGVRLYRLAGNEDGPKAATPLAKPTDPAKPAR